MNSKETKNRQNLSYARGLINSSKFIYLFLPGFLGTPEDFTPLLSHLRCPAKVVPLSLEIEEVLLNEPLGTILVGYSMGGRIALQMQARYPQHFPSLILLSSHLGLKTQEERRLQKMREENWLQAMRTLSLDAFISQWYAQPLFSSLKDKPSLFTALVQHRTACNLPLHAALFEKFRLSNQEEIFPLPNTWLFYGTKDLKYADLYSNLAYTKRSVSDAGHAVHLENPASCARYIEEYDADLRRKTS